MIVPDKPENSRTAAVSVVIPCYRCAATIRRAVDSVIAQTLPAREIILVDDCSNDGETWNALESLRRAHPASNISVLRQEENSGPGGARNTGWDAASQPYLAFLDADDSWHPKKLEIQYQWMAAHPEVTLSGHPSVTIRTGASMPDLPGELAVDRIGKYGLLVSNRFPTRSVMLKRGIPFRFVPGKRYSEDYLLWLTIVLGGHEACILQMPMACAYKEAFGDGGLTGDLLKMQQGELDAYRRLYSAGSISIFALILCWSISTVKFIRRWMIAKWRTRRDSNS